MSKVSIKAVQLPEYSHDSRVQNENHRYPIYFFLSVGDSRYFGGKYILLDSTYIKALAMRCEKGALCVVWSSTSK